MTVCKFNIFHKDSCALASQISNICVIDCNINIEENGQAADQKSLKLPFQMVKISATKYSEQIMNSRLITGDEIKAS
jgi:hypothetical protein